MKKERLGPERTGQEDSISTDSDIGEVLAQLDQVDQQISQKQQIYGALTSQLRICNKDPAEQALSLGGQDMVKNMKKPPPPLLAVIEEGLRAPSINSDGFEDASAGGTDAVDFLK